MVKLTPKQEKFCQCIVAGMSGKDSYISAYDTKGNDKTVNRESQKLLMRDDITERITELRKPLVNHALNVAQNERQKQIEFINERIEICKEREDEQSIIRYTDMKNRLLALYKDSEQEHKQDTNINKLDADTLKKIANIS